MTQLTEPQNRVLRELRQRGGEGVIDKHGFVVAQGERIRTDKDGTWLRLVTLGMIEPAGPHRVRITALGKSTASGEPQVKVHQFTGAGRHIPAIEGAE